MPPESFAGIDSPGDVHLNPTVDALIDAAVKRGEGVLARNGALVARTGQRTGRSPKDRYFVKHGDSEKKIEWGPVNQPFEPHAFDSLGKKIKEHLSDKELFVIDGYVGADPAHEIKLRVIAEFAWHALFCKQLFRRLNESQLEGFTPDFMVVSAPTYKA
ncbi:MAG: phosphoenolpyruvate carboxykinase (ATP), partial [Actinobacteria bacterium]|nr:phosphoenolpyruvate carboxykinase (ATP) [Actinomycetota bacterium]